MNPRIPLSRSVSLGAGAGIIFCLLMACSSPPPAETGPAAEAEEEAHIVHLEPEDVESWGLVTGPPGVTTVAAEVELPGVLTTNGNRTARIASLVAGQVAQRMADLGSRVRAGDALVALNAPEFTRAQTAFLQAWAQSELSRKDYERAVVLRDQRAIEEREFLRRQSLYEQQVAELSSAEAILRSLGVGEDRIRSITDGLDVNAPVEEQGALEPLLPVRTPIGGVVIQREVVLGDPVDPGQTLFTVSDLSVLWAQLDAYEEQLPGIGPDAEVVIRSPLFPDVDFQGRITVISEEVDPELRTVRVRVEVPNADGSLRPNMFVNGFVRVRSPDVERIILPEDAVQLMEGRHVVFVALPPEEGEDHLRFEEREVVPGETLTEGRIILDGLDGTEEVVLDGAFTLKAEMTKGAGGHQHVH